MALSIKRTVLAILLVTVLLIALVGGVIKISTSQAYFFGHPHLQGQLAGYCPAPPIEC